MPAERKVQQVEEMRQWMEKCTVAVSTDYTGLGVTVMTGLRRALRDKDIEYRVVKNRLAHLAAEAADRPGFKEIISGPTGIAVGYGEPTDPAKTLSEYLRANRIRMDIRGGMLGDRALTTEEVRNLAQLPSREELIAPPHGSDQRPRGRLGERAERSDRRPRQGAPAPRRKRTTARSLATRSPFPLVVGRLEPAPCLTRGWGWHSPPTTTNREVNSRDHDQG